MYTLLLKILQVLDGNLNDFAVIKHSIRDNLSIVHFKIFDSSELFILRQTAIYCYEILYFPKLKYSTSLFYLYQMIEHDVNIFYMFIKFFLSYSKIHC